MGWAETPLQQEIRAQVGGNSRARLFRNNVGWAYPKNSKRPVQFGLCEGSSDLIGIKAVEITPEMVGQTIGQFVAVEVKSTKGSVRKEQTTFLEVIGELGGLCIVARSLDDIEGLL